LRDGKASTSKKTEKQTNATVRTVSEQNRRIRPAEGREREEDESKWFGTVTRREGKETDP
jgi:hypothetical protein